MTTWDIEVCDRFGNNVVPQAKAWPVSASERLNQPRTVTWRIGVTDPDAIAADLTNCVIRRDSRIYRDGEVFLWGPIMRVEANRSYVEVQAHDPFVHFHDLYFGPIQNQYITNPNGASGLTGWSSVGLDSLAVDTTDFVRGNTSFLLVESGADADSYMQQLVTVTSNVDQAVVFTLAGWAKVEQWNGPAYGERGLYVERQGAALVTGTNPRWAPITETVTVGEWVRYETEISVPANTTDTLRIRAHGVRGRIRWGGLSLTVYESTGTGTAPEDAIHPINRVIDYAQNPAQGFPALNIARAGGLTGTLIEIHHQFADAGNIGEALLDYTRKGICDMGIVYPSGTRTLQIFSPRRGAFLPNVLLDIDVNGSLADFRYRVDGEQTYSAVRMMGTGAGPDREIGWATDYSATDGIRRERRVDAPSDSSVADLDRFAVEEVARAKAPVRVPTLTTHELAGDLIGVVNVGDSALCRIAHGCVQENTVRRIVGWDLDIRAETMTLEVTA